jgi:hypothetical protein
MHIFLDLVIDPVPVEFRAFLHRHADLRAVPRWRIRLLVPRHLAEAMATYQRTFHEEFASALGVPWSTN